MKIKRNCLICNKSFETYRKKQMCCSISCGQKNRKWTIWNKNKTKETDKRLKIAGLKISEIKKEQFASKELIIWNKGKGKKFNIICQICKNIFIANSKKPKVCSLKCNGVYQSIIQKNRVFEESHINKLKISARKRILRNNQFHSIGKNEKELLDKQEQIDKIPIYRQYEIYALGYIVDGYNPFVNTVYEVYEPKHRNRIEKDLKRQKEIEEALNCKFVIIKDGW